MKYIHQKEYVRPEEANIELPEEKRNLIYIFLESMETTYYSTQDGGLSQYDLIPEISRLAKENVNFSDTDKLGGAYTLYGTTWTVGAMSAQTAGMLLKLSIEDNALEEYSIFLGGAYSIGQVLHLEEEEIYLNNTEIMKYGILSLQEQKTKLMNKFGGDSQMISYLIMQKKK